MATAPCFHWPHHSPAAGALDSDAVAGFGLDAPEMAALMAPAPPDSALLAPPDHRAAVGRPRMRRSSHGKQQQQKAGGAKKPPQRGLGVAELERLRCGGDTLRELAGEVDAGAAAQVHPLVQCNHSRLHHHHAPAAALDARYCSSLLAPPAPAAAPGCYGHHPAAPGCRGDRAASLAPEQQFFVDRWGRMGPGFGGDHRAQSLLLAPEHPSSQSTIWRPAASSSSCLHSGHCCDLCPRVTRSTPLLLLLIKMNASSLIMFAARMLISFVFLEDEDGDVLRGERRSAAAIRTSPASHCRARLLHLRPCHRHGHCSPGTPAHTTKSRSPPAATSAVLTDSQCCVVRASQGESAFQLVRDRKRGALVDEAPAKKEVREIDFFPAASAHHHTGRVSIEESEFVASHYGAGSYVAAPLDLSLRL